MRYLLCTAGVVYFALMFGCAKGPGLEDVREGPRLPSSPTRSESPTTQSVPDSMDSTPPDDVGTLVEQETDALVDSEPMDAGIFSDAEARMDTEFVDMSVPPVAMITEEMTAILDDIPGYGQGTIGGKEGELYVVTTLANDGPGSLRAATESTDPLWIVFEDGLNGTIRLESQLQVESYKTIDARGHEITLQAVRDDSQSDFNDGWYDTGIAVGRAGDQVEEVHDIVFLNLTFDGAWPHPDEDNEGADGIHIHNHVHHVWVHQCTFHNWTDGAIDMRVDDGFETLPHHISITNSHFYDIHQGFILEAERITFARNFCDNVNKRCVKTIEQGSAHMVNNVIRNWRQVEIIYAKHDSSILVDHNIFEPFEDSRTAGRNSGNVQDVHNVQYGGQRYRINGRSSVSSAFKAEAQSAYGPDRKVDCEHDPVDRNCWSQLYNDVINGAGARISN